MRPENEEFAALLKASGWKAAEAARRLELTPGVISQYGSGKSAPSKQVLALFKLILSSENPDALSARPEPGILHDAPPLSPHARKLEEIPEPKRGLIKQLIDEMHRDQEKQKLEISLAQGERASKTARTISEELEKRQPGASNPPPPIVGSVHEALNPKGSRRRIKYPAHKQEHEGQ